MTQEGVCPEGTNGTNEVNETLQDKHRKGKAGLLRRGPPAKDGPAEDLGRKDLRDSTRTVPDSRGHQGHIAGHDN